MSHNLSKRNTKNQQVHKKGGSFLPWIAVGVSFLAIAVAVINPIQKSEQNNASNQDNYLAATLNENGDIEINMDDISEQATYFKYDNNGVTMGLFAVKASDGTIRTAFDTCQICNGSPRAYFEQEGNKFKCQNCGNVYSVDMIEQERGGCNPVPITIDEKTVDGTKIVIPASLMNDNKSKFIHWRQL